MNLSDDKEPIRHKTIERPTNFKPIERPTGVHFSDDRDDRPRADLKRQSVSKQKPKDGLEKSSNKNETPNNETVNNNRVSAKNETPPERQSSAQKGGSGSLRNTPEGSNSQQGHKTGPQPSNRATGLSEALRQIWGLSPLPEVAAAMSLALVLADASGVVNLADVPVFHQARQLMPRIRVVELDRAFKICHLQGCGKYDGQRYTLPKGIMEVLGQ